MNHLMIDLETLGNGSNAVIVAIGACFFDPEAEEIGAKFYRNVDAQSCIDLGMQVDGSTVMWWLDQSKPAQQALLSDRVKLWDALKEFKEWLSQSMKTYGVPHEADAMNVWSHATFDFVILNSAHRAAGLWNPLMYKWARDIRTINHLAGDSDRVRRGTHHNALDDAIYQAEYVGDMINKLKERS